ncbi:nitroreductase family protein [Chloroflexota bacterium]
MNYEDFLELVKNRRSIRRFKPDPIPDDSVDKIIEAARWAPSGFNSQPWEFVVLKNQELKDRIVELISEYRVENTRIESARESWQKVTQTQQPRGLMDYGNAPVFILLFGDTRTKAGLPMAARFNYQLGQSVFISSLACAFMYMHLAATSLGLASQWLGGVQVPFIHCLLKDILGMPEELDVYGMMAVGYPASWPRPKLMRENNKFIHYDHFNKSEFRTDEEVNDFIRRTRTWVIATMGRGAD